MYTVFGKKYADVLIADGVEYPLYAKSNLRGCITGWYTIYAYKGKWRIARSLTFCKDFCYPDWITENGLDG